MKYLRFSPAAALLALATLFCSVPAHAGDTRSVAKSVRGITIEEANAEYAKAIADFEAKKAQLLMDQIKLAQANARLGVDTKIEELHWDLIKLDFNNLVSRSKRTSRTKVK